MTISAVRNQESTATLPKFENECKDLFNVLMLSFRDLNRE
jgi:hypothetical protein